MKNYYKTPMITIEELTKRDVLCSSGGGDINPDFYDNAKSSGSGMGTNDLGGLTNVI